MGGENDKTEKKKKGEKRHDQIQAVKRSEPNPVAQHQKASE
jgi:hypothetical protein